MVEAATRKSSMQAKRIGVLVWAGTARGLSRNFGFPSAKLSCARKKRAGIYVRHGSTCTPAEAEP